MHQNPVKPKDRPSRIKCLVYGATGCCISALALFLVGFVLDAWSVSRHNQLAQLGMFRLCLPVALPSGFPRECATVGWDCTAQQCDMDAVPATCRTWDAFSPSGAAAVDGSTTGTVRIPFPGHGECGAFNAARMFLVMAFVGTGVAALILVQSMSEPCAAKRQPSHAESSPLLICTAGVITCCTYILLLICILVFLLDVFNSATSVVGSSLILAGLSAALLMLTLVLIVTAAAMSVNEEAPRSPSRGPRLRTYRVGGSTVTVADPKAPTAHDTLSEEPAVITNKPRLTPTMTPNEPTDFPMSAVCGLELVAASRNTPVGNCRLQEVPPCIRLGTETLSKQQLTRFGSLPVSQTLSSHPLEL